MDYEPGCQVSDREAIIALGLEPRQVARLLSELFCEMVFVHGFVHCDPHPGNVLVRRAPGGGAPRAQVSSPDPTDRRHVGRELPSPLWCVLQLE
jgi:predicted unusual protein kinase regulating ubiquinone biosynthesis (AarF/ABC1/UbiB family)